MAVVCLRPHHGLHSVVISVPHQIVPQGVCVCSPGKEDNLSVLSHLVKGRMASYYMQIRIKRLSGSLQKGNNFQTIPTKTKGKSGLQQLAFLPLSASSLHPQTALLVSEVLKQGQSSACSREGCA